MTQTFPHTVISTTLKYFCYAWINFLACVYYCKGLFLFITETSDVTEYFKNFIL